MKFSRIDELMIQYFFIDDNLHFSLTFMLPLISVMESTCGRVGEMEGIYFNNL